MNIEITIKAPELASAIVALSKALTRPIELIAEEQTEPIMVKTETVKDEKPVEEKPKPKAKAETKKDAGITLSDVRAKFVQIAQSGKRDELKALLDEFGADNVSSLKDDDLDAVYKRLGEL